MKELTNRPRPLAALLILPLLLSICMPVQADGPLRRWLGGRNATSAIKTSVVSEQVCTGPGCHLATPRVTIPPVVVQPTRRVVINPIVSQTSGVPLPLVVQRTASNAPMETAFSDAAASKPLSENKLRPAFLDAVRSARKSGDITSMQALQLRVASFSPAFLDRVEQMCLVQMAFSGADGIPMGDDGTIDKTAINWGELADFLERVLPLLLDLLTGFGLLG